MAGGPAGPRRRDDAEEAHRLHHGQRAPRVQCRQDASREDELQTETVAPHRRRDRTYLQPPHTHVRIHRRYVALK